MVTMVDEIFDRTYQSGRADLHASIDRGFARLISGFQVLNRIQFAAPWNEKPRGRNIECA